jgi:hypothetical protein
VRRARGLPLRDQPRPHRDPCAARGRGPVQSARVRRDSLGR